ncbi:MAG TPA: zinc ribbon domain-containing protein [Candidatus Krumholzibacteria bacterium]|nr:zinc ribbon domain-containing protein [Candidatus Krumholzibacteria bacterium]
MTELLLVLLAVVSVAFCFRPFMRGNLHQMALSRSDTPIGRLNQRKETLLQNIADLDFEYNMGKLSEEDYSTLRGNLKQQAMETLEQIDLLRESNSMLAPKGAPKPQLASGASFCSKCGTPLGTEDRFCSACGARVSGNR